MVPGLPHSYLLFLGDVTAQGFAKTALGLHDWAPEACVGEYRLPGCQVSAGLPQMTPGQAHAQGARALLVGVAPAGGAICSQWLPALNQALEAGLDLVSGMHARLDQVPELAEAAARHGRRLYDVRVPPAGLPVGTGRRRTGKRLLTVGTDCAVGKKYAALALAREMKSRGVDATFRATGQTGIMIAGSGIPMDAVVSDFLAGAAEALSPDAAPGHWDVVEGQGSLFHPAYAGVTLGLLHGSQPDVFVVCHEYGRKHVLGLPDFPLPEIDEVISMTVTLGRRTNPSIRCGGVALNTGSLSPEQAGQACAELTARLGLPVADPMRPETGLSALVDGCLA